MLEQDIQKLYYTIGEVSEMTGIEAHVLRYWETEFKELSPRKHHTGKRLYRASDIQVVRYIKNLLHEERYTIEGARKKLKLLLKESSKGELSNKNQDITEIRNGLNEIKRILNS